MHSPYSAHHSPYRLAKMIIIVGFVFVAYMLYALTVEMYKNYQIDRHIENFEMKNQALLDENRQKIEDLQYYSSDAYVEKIAKQSLSLLNPGEKLIVLSPSDNSDSENNASVTATQSSSNTSHFVDWWRFFFGESPYLGTLGSTEKT